MEVKMMRKVTVRNVSVPLRGMWFEIVEDYTLDGEYSTFVSVPLRGMWFEIILWKQKHRKSIKSFRPLTGNVV